MRLTMQDREKIIRRVVADTFESREKRAEEARKVFGLKVYERVVSEALLAQMLNLPERIIPRGRSIIVSLKASADGHGNYVECALPQSLPIPHCLTGLGPTEVLVDAHLTGEVMALDSEDRRHGRIYRDKEALAGKLRSLLASCATLKRLKEVWPEGAKWYEHLEQPKTPAAQVPAVLPQEVNRIIATEMGVAS